ncbi:MAG: hypothetical protein Q8O55_01400 [Dehalococcoidales bacterium]|nr:hypothetical protein [Dehalococcoidales bacterium]
MAVRIFQATEFKEEIKQLFKDGVTLEEIVTRFPAVSKRTIYRYQKEAEAEKANPAGERTGGPAGSTSSQGIQKVVKTPQELAVVTSQTPGPIVFRMGGQSIDLNPANIYDAFRYCEDIKRIDPSIDDDFSTMVKTACKHVWEVFSEREARRINAEIEIVKEGKWQAKEVVLS